MKKVICLMMCAMLVVSLCACRQSYDTDTLEWVNYCEYELKTDTEVKNIILMIGDGMGENTIKCAEMLKGDKLVMSSLPYTTHVTTDSLSGTTDSSAAATAMSCGIKTYNQYVGVDKDKNDIESICEFAMARGLKSGLVATQIINHATPAGMIAHTDYRQLYQVIINQMVTAKVDVMLGGGNEYHTKKLQKLLDANEYTYIETADELKQLDKTKDDRVLGMFSYQNIEAGKTPALATMTSKALDLLDNDNGFFLMVEGSDIDVQLSKINMSGAMKEMQSFDKAVDVVLRWAEDHPGTLVIVTADHETGGVTIPDSKDDINDSCITSGGEHTNTNVLLMAGGARADEITKNDVIDNTDIAKFMRKFLNDTYGKAPTNILNHNNP